MRKILVIFAAAVFSVSAFYFFYFRQHWCGAISFDRVMYAEDDLNESALYQCPDGTLIVWLQKDSLILAVFVLDTKANKVGGVSPSALFKFDAGIFSQEMPLKPGFLGEVEGKNDDIDPRLEITDKTIRFFPYANDKRIMIVKRRN